ncbi:hypothetical protein K435DRAFT_465685 [Dendrothele bispora CBS 962.96]|uniref:Uncharacterized protein n=1 Tax=Dendrothele bispora (strain CBS 962.96) TaxID=1314807 RepID=A0A4S8L0P0_DENBC|nr:hypothetical protein K435DRAFT_465685 [Dendrothele bispora CBS 962.96]
MIRLPGESQPPLNSHFPVILTLSLAHFFLFNCSSQKYVSMSSSPLVLLPSLPTIVSRALISNLSLHRLCATKDTRGEGATTLPALSQISLKYSGKQQWFQGSNLTLREIEM